jgi:hypothetical protein
VKKRDELRCIEEKKTKETSPIWESCLERAYLWGERIESIWEKNYMVCNIPWTQYGAGMVV